MVFSFTALFWWLSNEREALYVPALSAFFSKFLHGADNIVERVPANSKLFELTCKPKQTLAQHLVM